MAAAVREEDRRTRPGRAEAVRRRVVGPIGARVVLTLACGAIPCCGGGGSGGGTGSFVVARFDPGLVPESVALNQPIAIMLSTAVRASSVSGDTVQIRRYPDFSIPARGVFVVEGERVSFVPDLPRDFEHPDGGLEIGARYRVRLPASPDTTTLVDGRGRRLEVPFEASFTVSSKTDPPDFIDPVAGPPSVVDTTPRSAEPAADDRVSVDSPVVVSLSEPVFPAGVTHDTVRLLDLTGGGARALPGRLGLEQDATGARILFEAFPSLPENATVEIRVEG